MHLSGKILIPIGLLVSIIGIVLIITNAGEISDIDEFQYEQISSGELIIEDIDEVGDYGFVIFVEASVGDSDDNGKHDYCENTIINATHSGQWIRSPWSEYSQEQPINLTREVFYYEISEPFSGCNSDFVPETITYEGKTLVKIGGACFGCMKGNTTINSEDNVSMWIKYEEEGAGAIGEAIGGGLLTCCGLCFVGLGLILGFSIKSNSQKVLMGQVPVYQQQPNQTMMTQPVYEEISDVPIMPQTTLEQPEKSNFWDQEQPQNPF
tara:strand:+ start:151 stop:948 length:798 start_codon:yes stop_codon:yes gene_type:complete